MNIKFPVRLRRVFAFFVLLGVVGLAAGCATRNTMSGGRETSLLAGTMTIATESFQPPPITSINTDTSKIIGHTGPSGKKVTLFWGLFTFHDY